MAAEIMRLFRDTFGCTGSVRMSQLHAADIDCVIVRHFNQRFSGTISHKSEITNIYLT
jgi:hypothetical protein